MTDGEALFAAILAEPEEDTPRLVYADWLDENGQPERAAFIRVQVALETAPSQALKASEKVLLALHGDTWLAPLKMRGQPLDGGAAGMFRRGFVEIVWLTARAFIEKAPLLFARAPVRELRVTRSTAEDFQSLMTSPRLARLRTLDLSSQQLGDRGVAALVRSQFSSTLKVLRFRGCGISDFGAMALADTDFDRSLRELDLSFNPISESARSALRDKFGEALVLNGCDL